MNNTVTIILGLILAVGLYLIPSPLQRCPKTTVVPDTVVVYKDTLKVPYPKIYWRDTSGTRPIFREHTPAVAQVFIPSYFEKKSIDTTINKANVSYRTRTYPYVENDTLKADITMEMDIEPAPLYIPLPAKIIHEPYPVPVPVKPPFYEKPAFVATVTAITVIGLGYLLRQATK